MSQEERRKAGAAEARPQMHHAGRRWGVKHPRFREPFMIRYIGSL